MVEDIVRHRDRAPFALSTRLVDMKKTRFALAALFVFGSVVSAAAWEPTNVSTQPNAAPVEDFVLPTLPGQGDLAANTPNCRKVDVDLDEGYGVTGHTTRDECVQRRQ
jgi:hypothetical protein